MDLKQALMETPRALRETLEKGRPEYEALIRRTRWGEGPVFILSQAASDPAGLAVARGFESLLGWPVCGRGASDFLTYSLPVLRSRSIVLAVPDPKDEPAMLEAAQAIKARGATLLALTHDPKGALAGIAEGVFLVRSGEAQGPPINTVLCRHAVANYLPLLAARIFTRPRAEYKALEEEFEKLPSQIEWMQSQLLDAVRSFSRELSGLQSPGVYARGFYEPAALEWAELLNRLAGFHARCPGVEVGSASQVLSGCDSWVFLSGSRCRLKKEVHRAAGLFQGAGARIFAVTDANDRELADTSSLALLLPVMSEMVGSTMTLALLQWVAYYTARERGRADVPSDARPSRARASNPHRTR